MSHRHFCDAAGHDWYCEGRALRLGANEPSDCICVVHQTAMEEGDHTSCPIELLACPEHRDEQQRKMKDAVSKCGDGEMDAAPEDWTDKDSGPIFGFCL